MTFIKFCGITNEADTLLAVGLGADALGVIFAPSPRQVSVAAAGDIVRRLPQDAVIVGVFRDEAPVRVVEIADQLGLRAVQLHGHETIAEVAYVKERVQTVIKAYPATSPQISSFTQSTADLLLIDGPSPGSGEVFDWRLAEGVVDPDRLIVSGGLNAENVHVAIERLRPFGVDVASGIEVVPGVKDPRKMRAFIDAVRAVPGGRQPVDVDEEGPFDWSRR